jgi:hypothetical protein
MAGITITLLMNMTALALIGTAIALGYNEVSEWDRVEHTLSVIGAFIAGLVTALTSRYEITIRGE